MSPELLTQAKALFADLPWSIVLPAGCGKTELIATIAATIDNRNKPLLVLTHTNAGVDVIRKRFSKYEVPKSQARVFTLDTWTKLFTDFFPLLGSRAVVPEGTNLWTDIRLRAKEIFATKHIGDIIKATYSAILIDEYQDCSDLQHEIVIAMSKFMPVGVLGDPMQGIFDFADGVVDWTKVKTAFPPKELAYLPHRWVTRNPALGQWLLTIRPLLIPGGMLDLAAPNIPIIWQQTTIDSSTELTYCMNAATTAGNQKQIVALFQQPAQGHKFARRVYGKFNVAEEIECKVVKKLMTAVDTGDGGKIVAAIIKFAKECCVGCLPIFNQSLIEQYSAGTIKTYRSNNPNAALFDSLNRIVAKPTAQNIKNALNGLRISSTRVFRWEAWKIAIQVIDELAFKEKTAVKLLEEIRNRRRYGDQQTNRHSISRTLLVKGQEYDECIIIGADGMSARNLYVALSRGIDKVTVFSSSSILIINRY